MRVDRALGWIGLLLIGLIGVSYRVHDWLIGRAEAPTGASPERS